MTAEDMGRARRVLMRRDPVLAPLIKKYGACGIKTGRENDIFCGLVEAIVSQQLSTRAAATIYGRLRALLPMARPRRKRCSAFRTKRCGASASAGRSSAICGISAENARRHHKQGRSSGHERRRDRRGTDENQRNWALDGGHAADFPADPSPTYFQPAILVS